VDPDEIALIGWDALNQAQRDFMEANYPDYATWELEHGAYSFDANGYPVLWESTVIN
jgi:hypothetical protein